ncbi:hypothetical protein [Actinomycetospora termitidis]|uniref:Uncharacterized protein n=1 Tax=Actinomycetospora termitidis TaxID=3053470 RepID=A0ABT7MFK5_9PSEU|nr:hypothetical protein [Actinomycetospora sp. Odt1-22]MDL5158954.1 hypothetical protein [Actinomycetospora sp. Odt1-22]
MTDRTAPWTQRDTALWHTCDLAAAMARGEYPTPKQTIASSFPPCYAPDERFWASGPYSLSLYFAMGDGSYESSTTIAGGTGLLGMALLAATATGSAVGNARRRREAAALAVPQWHVVQQGVLHASGYGVYLQSAEYGLGSWDWWSLLSAEMLAPGVVQFQGRDTGPFVIASDWAELVFVTWAICRFPGHHQLVTGTWLPEGWLAHAAAHHPTALRSPALQLGR